MLNEEYTRNVRVLLERFGETGAARFTTAQQAAARFHHRYDHMQRDHNGQRVERLDVLRGVRGRVCLLFVCFTSCEHLRGEMRAARTMPKM